MPKPSDIPDDEWVAAFVKHRDARNQNGKLAIRPRVALELGLSVTAVNNYMTRRPDLKLLCHEAAGMGHPG